MCVCMCVLFFVLQVAATCRLETSTAPTWWWRRTQWRSCPSLPPRSFLSSSRRWGVGSGGGGGGSLHSAAVWIVQMLRSQDAGDWESSPAPPAKVGCPQFPFRATGRRMVSAAETECQMIMGWPGFPLSGTLHSFCFSLFPPALCFSPSPGEFDQLLISLPLSLPPPPLAPSLPLSLPSLPPCL